MLDQYLYKTNVTIQECCENIAWEKAFKINCKSIYCFVYTRVKNKKISSILKSTALNFSELYIKRSTKRSDFLKRLKTLIHWEGMKKNKKNISKKSGNKRTIFLQWNIVI
ncbi:MAG: hypothetical protein ACMUEL_06825 [Flavobacteriales bacterium Tduv]